MTEQAAQTEAEVTIEGEEAQAPSNEVKPDASAESATATDEEGKGGFVETDNDAVQARIDKLTYEKHAAIRAQQEAERRAAELEAQTKAVQAPVDQGEPTLEQFDYDESRYQAALIDYRVKQATDKVLREQQEAQQAAARQQTEAERDIAFNAKVEQFRTKATDYDQVVMNVPYLQPETLSALKGSEKAAEVAYYLGKNPDIAMQVANASPLDAAMTIGRIDASLSNVTNTTKTASAAPDPIDPITPSGAISDGDEGPPGATYE